MSTQLETEPITVLVEFPQRSGVRKGLLGAPDLAQQSAQALDKAMDSIQGMAQRVTEMRKKLPAEMAAVEIEFGLKLDAEAGALVAKMGGEASIQVRLKWEKGKK